MGFTYLDEEVGAGCLMQVLADAAAIDAKAESGQPITPLCGMPLVRCQVAAKLFGRFVMVAMLTSVAENFTCFEHF